MAKNNYNYRRIPRWILSLPFTFVGILFMSISELISGEYSERYEYADDSDEKEI